ncbi:rRNA-processing protein EFG1-like [Nicotiana tomentosiformis]|uniref:rRNA-processing protein EFG1-like n=1 Tax=Nicotiana tomentosiformis TaxID=4098 RepID=UPI00388C5838
MVVHKAPPRTEDISEKDLGRVPELLKIEDASHRSQRMRDMSEWALLEYLRIEENAPSDLLGAVAIKDSPTFPVFSARVIREAQALGALELDRPHDGEDPFHDLFTGIKDVIGTSDASDLFHGVQRALNQAAVAHRKACSWSRAELCGYEAYLQRVTEERNSLKCILGQRAEEIKDLRVELAKAHQDQTDLSEQEKSSVQARRIEELEARLASELAKAESNAKKAKADMDALVAVYRADAEAAQVQAREAAETADTRAHWVAELAKWRSRRETLEEINARGVDLAEEINRAKKHEDDAEALVSDDDDDNNEDDESKSGSENGGEPDREETAPGDNQEA